MADKQIPLFPKATSMFVHSGNIINWNRLKRKPNLSPTDELCDCVSKALGEYITSSDKTALQYVTEIYKVSTENVEALDESERHEVKVTVKVFICTPQSPNVIQEAVNKVLNELGTSYVETLLLSLSPTEEEEDSDTPSMTLEKIQPYWEVMEELVGCQKVLSVGICDLNKEVLEDLYTWSKVKPVINQVNLESCCVMPKELTEYAKEINVQLLTHNDSPVFLTKERLQETLHSVSTDRDSDAWSPQWAVRYSGIIKCRGIIKMKGYVFHAQRDNKKRLL